MCGLRGESLRGLEEGGTAGDSEFEFHFDTCEQDIHLKLTLQILAGVRNIWRLFCIDCWDMLISPGLVLESFVFLCLTEKLVCFRSNWNGGGSTTFLNAMFCSC